ncbi:hypothetical protein BC943DRAFT_324940 [Umbelopsis sp. AD052]|nr:hypothetical protein BC943DRAFT_324940 [Umbelopsis sp. AD052]
MNWTGSISTNIRCRKSKDRQAQKDFFNRQRLLRAQKSYIESNAEMRINNSLTRAVHLTMSSQRNSQTYTSYKKLDQRVSDFQKAALLQKCHQINEQENKLNQSETVDKLLSDASKLCGHSTNTVSSNQYSSSIHTPCDPLFDFETTTSSTSILGCISQAKLSLEASTFDDQLEHVMKDGESFHTQSEYVEVVNP